MKKTLVLTIALLMSTAAFAQTQLKFPRPSQKSSVMQTVGVTDITINYNRPAVRGRQIWGALVPYDQVWRTGANEATTIEFSDDVLINGQKLPKGLYSLHTKPGRDNWTVMFNSVAKQWGSYSYDAAKDVLSVTVKPEKADFREWLTFEIPEMTADTAKVVIRWENLAVPFTVDTQSTARSLAAAEKAIASAADERWVTPYQAANFAFQSGNMTQAQQWLDLALKEKENTATLWLKAQMLNKQGKLAEALHHAERAIAAARPDQSAFVSEIRRQSDAWKK